MRVSEENLSTALSPSRAQHPQSTEYSSHEYPTSTQPEEASVKSPPGRTRAKHSAKGKSKADAYSEALQQTPLTLPLSAMHAAVQQKGLDIRALDLRGFSDIADAFLIVSGTSARHVRGIADKIKDQLQKNDGETPLSINGYEEGEWVLLDYGDLIVHIFYEPARQNYRLDELWAKKGTVIPPPAELENEMRLLRTGIAW